MANSWFQFKQFTVHQDRCAMKVTTDACLFGAFAAAQAKKTEALQVLEIGTGTGLLSLLFAQKNPQAAIDAIEIDLAAAAQARENAEASPWGNRINIIAADAKEYTSPGKYDCIISNPPFYEKELKGEDPRKNLAHHNAGLLLPELLQIIQEALKPGGQFFLLLPYKRNEEIRKMLLENQLKIDQLVLVRQSSRHTYFRILLKGSRNEGLPAVTSIEEIAIREENDHYSSAFKALLEDYYLHL